MMTMSQRAPRRAGWMLSLAVVVAATVAAADVPATAPRSPPISLQGPEDFVRAALSHATPVLTARETEAEARARAHAAHAPLFPRLDAVAGAQRASDIAHGSIGVTLPDGTTPEVRIGSEASYDSHVEFSYQAWSGGRAQDAAAAVALLADAASADRARQERQTAADVRAAFWEALKAERLLHSATQNREALAAHRDALGAATRQGVALASDLGRAELRVTQAELAIVRAERGVSVTHVALLNLCGLPLTTDFSLAPALPATPPAGAGAARAAQIATIAQRATELRPELAARHARLAAAIRSGHAASRESFPSLGLSASAGYAKPGLNKFEVEWAGYWTVGASVRVPLWDGGLRHCDVGATQAAAERARLDAAQADTDIRLEVTRAHLQLLEAEKMLALTARAATQAAEDTRLVQVRFAHGTTTSVDALDAQAAEAQARDDDIRARADYAIALAVWNRATGDAHDAAPWTSTSARSSGSGDPSR